MNGKLRQMIEDMLVKNGLTETWKEAVKAEIPDGQAALADEDVQRKAMDYLRTSGMPLTEQNLELAKKMVISTGGADVLAGKQYVTHSTTEDFTDDELRDYMLMKLLENTAGNQQMEYKVLHFISEQAGVAMRVPYEKIEAEMNRYAEKGWRVCSAVTHELGNIATPLGASNTMSMTLVTMERPAQQK